MDKKKAKEENASKPREGASPDHSQSQGESGKNEVEENSKTKGCYNLFSWAEKSGSKEDVSKSKGTSRTASREKIPQRARAVSIVPDVCINKHDVSLTDVATASYRIRDEIHLTPCEKAKRIPEIQDFDVYFKREYLQVSGSYKTRGAVNALMTLSEKYRTRGVLGTSASSHALSLALHGKKFGIPVTIIAPENVHPRKLKLYDRHGARTYFAGRDDNEVLENAHTMSKAEGLKFIDENENSYVISGIGTIFLEIVEQLDDIDAIILPVGGGSLLAAACVVVKSLYPQIKIIGVESEHCPSFNAALKAGHPVTIKTDKGATFVDGLSSQRIGQLPFELAKNKVDKVVSVREDQIGLAVLRLLEKEKAIVEGSGAAGLAALLGGYLPELKGKRVVVPLCGGNIDPTVLGRAIERGLTADGRMVRFLVKIGDRPGSLARLTSIIASTGVSVKDLNQERTWLNSSIFSIQVKCVAEMRNAAHGEQLKKVLQENYKEDFIWNQTAEE